MHLSVVGILLITICLLVPLASSETLGSVFLRTENHSVSSSPSITASSAQEPSSVLLNVLSPIEVKSAARRVFESAQGPDSRPAATATLDKRYVSFFLR